MSKETISQTESLCKEVATCIRNAYDRGYKQGKADVLNKINAEIKETANKIRNIRDDNLCFFTEQDVLEIIDKYRDEVNEQQGD